MMVYYLDSSAWVKRYFEERGSDWVETRRQQFGIVAVPPKEFLMKIGEHV